MERLSGTYFASGLDLGRGYRGGINVEVLWNEVFMVVFAL